MLNAKDFVIMEIDTQRNYYIFIKTNYKPTPVRIKIPINFGDNLASKHGFWGTRIALIKFCDAL